MTSVFAEDWDTPFGVPPFGDIKTEDFSPAFEAALAAQAAEVRSIADSVEPATFDNTVLALERSGAMLDRVSGVFFNLTLSDTSPELQELEAEVTPKLAGHESRIYMDQQLFARFRAVQAESDLDGEDARLLAEYVNRFERAGAGLAPAFLFSGNE